MPPKLGGKGKLCTGKHKHKYKSLDFFEVSADYKHLQFNSKEKFSKKKKHLYTSKIL